MKNKTIVGTILVVFIIAGSIFAQEKEQKIELPQLTLEQKWGRTQMNLMATLIGGIAYAKSLGKSPEDFGRFLGELVAPSWEGVKGIEQFVRAMYRNWQVFKNFQMEILSESETSFKARIKEFGEADVKDWTESGVTVEEYFSFWEHIGVTIANYVGLNWEQKLEGDWVIITFTEKK